MSHVTVTSPSRLHFGLYAFAGSPRAFGGVGCMIASPRLELRVTQSERFQVTGPLAERVEAFASTAAHGIGEFGLPPCKISVESAPPEHAGLGLGTQLGLSVAAGLDAWAKGRVRPATELAREVSRGKRSAIGTHGFDHGGWIVDGGHQGSNALGGLEQRLPLPDSWRVLLVTPWEQAGLSGPGEENAFSALPAIPTDTTKLLRSLALERMAPAIEAQDFEAFTSALHAYGRHAGECFAPVQGGPFAGPHVEDLIETLLGMGVRGCGQSSWGPTVFAFVPNEMAAVTLRDKLQQDRRYQETPMTIAQPDNHGARIEIA